MNLLHYLSVSLKTMHKLYVKLLRCCTRIIGEERCSHLCCSALKLEYCTEGNSSNPFAIITYMNLHILLS